MILGRRAFIAGVAVALAGCSRPASGGPNELAAGEQGGMYLTFAELVADRMRARRPELGVEAVSTEGSVDNLARLRAGSAAMGLALADVAERDLSEGVSTGAPVAVARVYENYLQVVVRDGSDIRGLTDLAGRRISIGPGGSGAAATSEVLFAAAGLSGRLDTARLRLGDGLSGLRDGGLDAVVWSGGVPTPAISELHAQVPLRMLDIGGQAAAMSRISGYPYLVRRVPSGGYVPAGLQSVGVPNLLLCRPDLADDVVAAVVRVLAADAPQLVPPYVRGLQYLDPPSMIQTGAVPLHPGAVAAYRDLHG
jgi:uncharacterized protein